MARKQLQAMLEALPQEIGQITAEDMLPEVNPYIPSFLI